MGDVGLREVMVSRPLADLVEALRRHAKLLREYSIKAFDEGDDAYLGEVVGKLRLLVGDRGSNTPLLLQVARALDIKLTLTLGGPPMKRSKPSDFVSGDTVTLKQFLGLLAGGIRLPRGEWVEFTKDELIHVWSQQYGAAHEDWTVDEGFVAFRDSGIFIGGHSALAAELRVTTRAVLHVAERFLGQVTPETIAEAEKKRDKGKEKKQGQ